MANTYKRLGPLEVSGGTNGGGEDSTGFVFSFSTGTWILSGDEYQLTVPESVHLKGVAPSVDVYEFDGVGYRLVFAETQVTNAGLVIIQIPAEPDNRFGGKLIIT